MIKENIFVKTPEEAIKAIKANMPTSGYQMLRESLDMAIEALEKQIPIPVKNRTILMGKNGHPYSIRGDCPKCGCKWIMATKTDYCFACGQHLKWSVTLEDE